jgi:photosystem II stability/assembly factor-like uncharacterized protein
MRKFGPFKTSAFLLVILFTLAFSFYSCSHIRHGEGEDGMEEDLEARIRWENQMLADPATGKIPENIRAKELAYASTMPQYRALGKDGGDFWTSRGPWNVGGRTRAVAIDVSNEHNLLAAGVSGGIWRSTDDGANWTKVTPPSITSNVTCIVQNHRPGKQNIWYAGTGEFIGNSPSGNFAFYLGDGILKSVDNGLTWNKLPSTASGIPQFLSKDFDIINSIAINSADTGDVVYAATYGSVYKSSNGGKTWTKERGSISNGSQLYNGSQYTEVAATSTGVIYATLSSDGGNKGIWRSTDGNSWTNITPAGFPDTFYRTVIGISPSDENTVYFLGNCKGGGKKFFNFQKQPEWNTLWKYTYLGGNGSGTGGKWEDHSQNLPAFGGDFGDFITQGGYDLLVRVKPDDPNTVFIGGMNLWRSTDAFTSTKNISWIGGYGVNTRLPDYTMYPNQHPDQHNLVFYPSEPKRMIATCDGGIFRSDDNTSNNVTWSTLNNGYITSQFYSVAVDHATLGNDEVIGGLQDNGSYFTRSSDPSTNWAMSFNSDGCFSYITNGRTDYYASAQLGKVYRLHLDANGNYTELARVDPAGAKHRDFVNPWTFDPNDQKRMYFPSGHTLWINDDVTQIPMKTVKDTVPVNTGWSAMSFKADTFITAVSVSQKPADIVYTGTQDGKIYRINNASTASPIITDITGKAFPKGNINCIAIDPDDANKAIVVFSNYTIISLFYTTNGGTSWTNISSNLEQAATGGGNGPSCRWASIMPVGNGHTYFVATSTGLYSSDTLEGANTVWTHQSPDGIGYTVCPMIDTRPSDGLVAVATHGNGIYSAHISFPYQVTGIRKQTAAEEELNVYPNPVQDVLNINLDNDKAQKLEISILDEAGKYCLPIQSITASGKQLVSIDMHSLPAGVYYCRISGKDNVMTKQVVKVGN